MPQALLARALLGAAMLLEAAGAGAEAFVLVPEPALGCARRSALHRRFGFFALLLIRVRGSSQSAGFAGAVIGGSSLLALPDFS